MLGAGWVLAALGFTLRVFLWVWLLLWFAVFRRRSLFLGIAGLGRVCALGTRSVVVFWLMLVCLFRGKALSGSD